jgi:hypothetical protein
MDFNGLIRSMPGTDISIGWNKCTHHFVFFGGQLFWITPSFFLQTPGIAPTHQTVVHVFCP